MHELKSSAFRQSSQRDIGALKVADALAFNKTFATRPAGMRKQSTSNEVIADLLLEGQQLSGLCD